MMNGEDAIRLRALRHMRYRRDAIVRLVDLVQAVGMSETTAQQFVSWALAEGYIVQTTIDPVGWAITLKGEDAVTRYEK